MKHFILLFLVLTGLFIPRNVVGDEYPYTFRPIVFWENNVDIGVILATYTKMAIIDSKGNKHGEIIANAQVINIYMAPSGKKFVYTTANRVWLIEISTQKAQQISTGYCDYLRWSVDSQSFIFTVEEPSDTQSSLSPNVKLFWADGDGKNIKQIYP